MAVTKIWKINGWIGDCLLYILAEMFSLSEAQKQALAKEQYGTGLIKVGSTIVPFENDFPTDNPLYQLMSTKPSDGWGQEVNEHYDV